MCVSGKWEVSAGGDCAHSVTAAADVVTRDTKKNKCGMIIQLYPV